MLEPVLQYPRGRSVPITSADDHGLRWIVSDRVSSSKFRPDDISRIQSIAAHLLKERSE